MPLAIVANRSTWPGDLGLARDRYRLQRRQQLAHLLTTGREQPPHLVDRQPAGEE